MIHVDDTIDLCIQFNETIDSGIVKLNLLSSAFSSYHYYDRVDDQISSIVKGIIKNHPFKDGNKRTATFVLYYLSDKYGLKLIPDHLLDDVIVDIASNHYDVDTISKLLFV